ncbi:hypothetical protein Hanom_Chr08g00725741 [Helianthus anomalus]
MRLFLFHSIITTVWVTGSVVYHRRQVRLSMFHSIISTVWVTGFVVYPQP